MVRFLRTCRGTERPHGSYDHYSVNTSAVFSAGTPWLRDRPMIAAETEGPSISTRISPFEVSFRA